MRSSPSLRSVPWRAWLLSRAPLAPGSWSFELFIEESLEPRYELAEPERCDPDCFHDHLTIVVERP
jgi:hypothetical protein